jgi:hypothetical protein
MTVKRAKEILGEEIENLPDKEIQVMIDRDFRFCDAIIDVIMSLGTSLTVSSLTNYEKQN